MWREEKRGEASPREEKIDGQTNDQKQIGELSGQLGGNGKKKKCRQEKLRRITKGNGGGN